EWKRIRRSSRYSCLSANQRPLTRPGKAEKGLGFGDPAADGSKAAEIEAAFMRNAGIGEERDVGERNHMAGEETAAGKMLLHAVERCIAALDLFRSELGGILAEIHELEA